ncbi:MAG: CBS domain-containing protein [Bacillota bacterium]
MIVITTHVNTDLDGLAAMVAARKLYPDAELVLPGKLALNVEEFVALHRDILEFKTPKEVNLDTVSTLVLVDTKNAGRIAKLGALAGKPGVQVHIYDHHPRAEGDIRGSVEIIEPLGAATTILVEKLQERQIALSPFEATVLALGIYEDTGCLVFNSTTSRDAEAVAFLIKHGANLAVVAEYLGKPLSEEQQGLLRDLLLSAQRYLFNGIKVLVTQTRVNEFISGLALLTHKLGEIERTDAVFCVVEMDDRVHIVGRSSVQEINVRAVLEHFGGGGHPAAASATVKFQELDNVVSELIETLKIHVRPPLTAADIMSSPVKSVPVDTRIEDANQVMLRYGHTGLPVVQEGSLVGVISRRDVEKAVRHGLAHAPVKAFMARNVLTVAPNTPVTEIQAIMVENNIGRLPVVVDGGVLVGIVSRTDVLKTLHKSFQPRYQTLYQAPRAEILARNLADILRKNLSEDVFKIVVEAGRVADTLNCRVYLTGGMIRDAILGRPNRDFDFVIESCDCDTLANALARHFGGKAKVAEKGRKTLVYLPRGPRLDITRAQQDFREFGVGGAGAEQSPLRHELYRRDFTINAVAVVLNEEGFGDVVDFFGGLEDIRNGLIRALHNLSFIEDPVRILRAIRYEQRYHFNLERQTQALIREALNDRVLQTVPDERLWPELKRMLGREHTPRILSRFAQTNIWPHLFPSVVYWEVQPVIGRIPRAIGTLNDWQIPPPPELWLVYFTAILHWSSPQAVSEICQRYKLGTRQTEKVFQALNCWREALSIFAAPRASALELARTALQMPREAYPLVLAMLDDESLRLRFRDAFRFLKEHKPSITGKDIRRLGYRPGPDFRRALHAVWQARMAGQIQTKNEEINHAVRVLEELGSG